MSQQRHIINKQILEVHVQEEATVNAMQTEILQMYHEKIVPIINDLCDRHSAAGTHCKIEKLTIDLGNVQMQDFATVFAEKFAEAIAPKKVTQISDTTMGTDAATRQKSPLDALSYYLMTGTLPWWAESSGKKYLHQLLDALSDAPDPVFKALIQQFARKKVYRDRFINTFTEEQVFKTLTSLSSHSLAHLPRIRQEMVDLLVNIPAHNPQSYTRGIAAQKVAYAFWSAVFAHVSLISDHSGLISHLVYQTLQALGADFTRFIQDCREKFPSSEIVKTMDTAGNSRLAAQSAIHRQVAGIKRQHRENPLLQAFCQQLLRTLSHPLFSGLESRQMQVLSTLLKNLTAAQKSARTLDAHTLKLVTESNLGPLAKHLQSLESRLRQMESSPSPKVMENLRSKYDDSDFITVQNAGLVILWPFLPRFFENLGLLHGKEFKDETSQSKAASLLQYLAGEAEEEIFEGQLTLNKVLCGINLSEPVAIEALSAEDKEFANGLLQAVIARGPHWKNLSMAGLQTSYLMREGLLRARDGHWLLQVKKETFDITLEKLPWGFGTVKLPWMNEILIIEWIKPQ